jgi:hypothetical protein
MASHNEILNRQVREQLAKEEHLCRLIEDQAASIGEPRFADARDLLIKTAKALEAHFIPLNALMDQLEEAEATRISAAQPVDGILLKSSPSAREPLKDQLLSKTLCDDYSALNLITISNTLLHTTALALQSSAVADAALAHLENLAPLVVKIGKMLPTIVVRELSVISPTVDLAIAEIATKNTREAWKRA